MSQETRIEELFLRVVDLDPDQRECALSEEGVSPELRQRVEALLGWDERVPEDFLRGEETQELGPVGGTRIGPYQILDRLGEGGMGTVYAARQSFPMRDVALKVLRGGRVSEDSIRRFRHEIDILGRLQHSGIARIYDAGVTESLDDHGFALEVPYFTMELVRGTPIVRYCREQGLTRAERIELLARVCDAVHYAHQRGVIHRDLKPDNVLVTAAESTHADDESSTGAHIIGQPKVLDFGIARVIDPELATTTSHTVEGALVGTLASMSPEQVSGEGRLVDVRSDVYALGVMLYELICDRTPLSLEGLTVPQAVHRILAADIEPAGTVDSALRGDLTTIAAKALERDAERRYQTAFDLAADLRCFLAGDPIEARADSRLYLLHRSLRRHRVAVGVALVFVLLLASFAFVSAQQARASARLAASEADARRMADADFERALQAVDMLTTLGTQELAGLPHSEEPRRRLLQASLDFHRELLDAHPEAAALPGRQALARFRVARLELELGHPEMALAEVQRSILEFESQLEEAPQFARDASLGLVSALSLLGTMEYQSGELDESEAHLRRAVSIARSLSRADGSPGRPLELFASSSKHLSNCLRAKGHLEVSLAILIEATDDLEERELGGLSAGAREELVGLLQQACNLRMELGSLAGVEPDLRKAVSLCEALRTEEPEKVEHRQVLIGLYSNLSVYLDRNGKGAAALEALDAGIEVGEQLARDHPARETPRRNLSLAYSNRAKLMMDLAQFEEAELALARAVELLDSLLALNRTPGRVGHLANLEVNQGVLQIHLLRYGEAAVTLESAIDHSSEALEALPGRPDLRTVHRNAHLNLAMCRIKLMDHAEAAAVLRRVPFDGPKSESTQSMILRLQLWGDAIRNVGTETSLEPQRRQETAEGYAGELARFLEEARAGGFDDFETLEAADDWTDLRRYPGFVRALAGAPNPSESE